jgi:predicted DNA-binding antitoxin AbrB/MazE fold protein
MTKTVAAVYENGTLRLVEPLPLSNGERVEVTVVKNEDPADHADFVKALQEIAALPLEGPDDGFSAADHDKVLYGDASGRRGDAR